MHYFIDHSKIGAEIKPHGPVAADPTTKYNVTTQFQLPEPAKAFACQDGTMLVLQATDPTLVNLIVRPTKGLEVPFGRVKYYIYRGILKTSFVDGSDITPNGADKSDFIRGLWLGYDLLKIIDSTAQPPMPESLGLFSLPDTLDVEKLFSTLDQQDVGKNFVGESMWIGNFGATCGFEIITEGDNYEIDLAYMAKTDHVIDISALPSATDAEKFALKCEKEKILNYLDPAAFWGMHYEAGIKLFDAAVAGNERVVSKEAIYTELLKDKYTNKNRVYLDLRSEHGYSYNFYENYADPAAGGSNLKFKTDGDPAVPYINHVYEHDWPIFNWDGGGILFNSYSSFFVQLRVNDNLKPLLYFQNKDMIPGTKRECLVTENELLDAASVEWTKPIEFRFANVNDGGMVVYIANCLKAQYFRQQENPASPEKVIRADGNLDKGLRMVSDPWFNELAYHPIDKKTYVSGSNFGLVAGGGVFYDSTRAILSMKTLFPYQNSKNKYAKLDLSNEPLKSITASPVFPKELVINKWQAAESAVSNVDILEIVGFNRTSATIPFKEDVFFLGLTTAEYDALDSNPDISKLHTRVVVLEEIPNQADVNLGIPFKKYTVKILGLNSDGKRAITTPAPALNVYGSGSAILASAAFASGVDVTTLLPDPATMKEYEFVGSFSYDPNDPIVTGLFSSGTIEVRDVLSTSPSIIEKKKIPLIGEVHFPVDSAGSNTISSKKSDYPLVVILHGNGQRYSSYRQLCEHLAHNGFIAASASCLMTTGKTEFPLTQSSPNIYYLAPASGTDAFYFYNNDPSTSIPDFEFEKLTVLQFRWDPVAIPHIQDETPYLLPWVKDKDFKIITDAAGKPKKIKFLFQVGGHDLNPVGRSRVLYPHLKILKAKFANKVQNNIGLLGHSRGGQAVTRSPQEISEIDPNNGHLKYDPPADLQTIKSVASLAPTDFEGWGKENLDENIPYLVVYGSRDGDVKGVRSTGFSLWDRAKNTKSMAFVYWASHNGFITNDHDWTDNGESISNVIPRTSQQTIAKSYFNAFFRMTLRNEALWKPLFTGEAQTESISTSQHKEIVFQYQDKVPVKLIDDFEDVNVDWTVVSGVGKDRLDLLTVTSSPHETHALSVDWTANCKLAYSVPPAKKNVDALSRFSFRITHLLGKVADLGELKIELKGGGTAFSVLVREHFKIPEPDLRPDTAQRKSSFMTIRLPLSKYRDNGVVLTDVTELNFIFPGIGSGTVEMDSIEFTD